MPPIDGAGILRATAPTGPGWVHAVVARRTYRHRFGFAQYDIAIEREGDVDVLHGGWHWIGRRVAPLVEILDEGWIPLPKAPPPPPAAPPGVEDPWPRS
jgi:hypothetical protein